MGILMFLRFFRNLHDFLINFVASKCEICLFITYFHSKNNAKCDYTLWQLPFKKKIIKWAGSDIHMATELTNLVAAYWGVERTHWRTLTKSKVSHWALMAVSAYFLVAVMTMMQTTAVCACGMLLLELSWQYCRDTLMQFVALRWAQMAVSPAMMEPSACGSWPPSASAPRSKGINLMRTQCSLHELPILWRISRNWLPVMVRSTVAK